MKHFALLQLPAAARASSSKIRLKGGSASFLASAAAVLMLLCSLARGQSDMVVYDDAIQNDWQDYSWATVNFSNTSPVHGGSKSISVTDPTTSYQALYLHHDQLSTVPYTSLQFWIYTTTSAAQPVQVAATRQGTAQTLVQPGSLTMNGWTQVTIPLTTLGVANVADFDGFWIQNITGGPLTFYVDDISLVAAPPPAQIQISVDASSAIRTLDSRLFGLNAAVWDNQLGNAANASLLSAAGVRYLRFPGGSLSDDYDWQTNRLVSDGSFQWVSSIATFAPMAESLGAQACITVNYGSGTPEQAAAWVAWCNAGAGDTTTLGVDSTGRDWHTSGYWAALRGASPLATDDGFNFLRIAHPTPFGFHDWEVGNENYGGWENDLHGTSGSGLSGTAHDPYTYAQAFAQFSVKMRAVDSSIRVGIPAVPGEDSYGNGTHPATNPNESASQHSGWTPVVLATLQSLGVTPQFLVDHVYPQGPGTESDDTLLQSTGIASSDAANIRKMITDYFGAGGSSIELQMTELNSVASNPGKQSVSLVNALFFADMIGQTARTEFNSCAWWALRSGEETGNNNSSSLYGSRQYGCYGILADGTLNGVPVNTAFPPYFTAKLLTNWGRGGDSVVSASSNYYLLTTHAARLASGNLALLVINKHPSLDLTAQVSLANFLPGSTTADVFSYGKPNDTSSTDITTATLSQVGSSFNATFPSYSMTVMVLQQPQSFTNWRAQNFTPTELADDSISGPVADPDHDGIPNLLEYSLGLSPKAAGSSGLPVAGTQPFSGKNYLTLNFNKPLTIGDVTYTVQVSNDLKTWNSGTGYVLRTDDGTTSQAVFRDATAIGDSPSHFIRLQVTLP